MVLEIGHRLVLRVKSSEKLYFTQYFVAILLHNSQRKRRIYKLIINANQGEAKREMWSRAWFSLSLKILLWMFFIENIGRNIRMQSVSLSRLILGIVDSHADGSFRILVQQYSA